jgi:predicted esterase
VFAVAICAVGAVMVWRQAREERSTAEPPTRDTVREPTTSVGADGQHRPALATVEGALSTKNASGRSSYFYLPSREPGASIPLLVGLHGAGADGREMIATFRTPAASRGFAILAPSSGYAAELRTFTWHVGDHPNDFSDDYRHVAACLQELEARSDVTIDPLRVLAVGFSGGGSSAPYLASNTLPYTAFAVLHGGVFIGGVGPRRVRGWFSTGDADTIRTPEHVANQFRTMQSAGFDVIYSTFPEGHSISDMESTAVVAWWLTAP